MSAAAATAVVHLVAERYISDILLKKSYMLSGGFEQAKYHAHLDGILRGVSQPR
jgi:hypothetical protein